MKNKIQHIIAAMALTLGFSYTTNAQVTAQKIGANPTNITPSAVLDIESANKGVLFPRVALASTILAGPINSPVTGLTVFNTATDGTAPNNVTPGYYYWNGSKWVKLATDAESSKWTYDAINSRVNLTNLANGTTARTGATSFGVHNNNILQIGDMTNVAGANDADKSIVTRKTGNNIILNVSDGGASSRLANEIYGGTRDDSGAYLEMIKHRGTAASPQIVQNGDLISFFDFRANTGGSATRLGARMRVGIDGAVTTGSTPMRISFETAAPGEGGPTKKFEIGSNGNVAIGNNTTANPAAILDVASVNKGVLLPRVLLTSITDVITVPSPVNGLTVFNTATAGTAPNNVVPGYYYWNGSRWTRLATAAEAFAKTVFVNATSPNTATIFAETNPATTNVDALKTDAANLYIGNDGSTWTYDPTGAGTYRTYIQPSSTPFNLANSTTDAGSNKTATIWRAGAMGIGTNNPISTFSNTNTPIQGTNTTNAFNGGLTWSAAGSGFAGSFYSQPTNGNGLLVKIAGNQSSNNALEVSRSTSQDASATITPLFNVKGDGFVGIGTSNPHTNLDIIGGMSLRTTAGIAGSHTGIEFNTNSNSPRIDWVFGGNYTGSFAGDADSFFRLHNSRQGIGGFRFTTNPSGTGVERLTILNNGNVGIGSTAPTSRLEVNGSATNRVSHNAGTSTTIDFSQSNLAYTAVSLASLLTNFTLNGIKDGGTYTLRVRSTTAGTANFSGSGFASTAFRSPNNGVAAAGDTLYTFMVIGDRVFFYMTTGL